MTSLELSLRHLGLLVLLRIDSWRSSLLSGHRRQQEQADGGGGDHPDVLCCVFGLLSAYPHVSEVIGDISVPKSMYV